MGRNRYTVTEPNKPHFFTCTVLHWIPIFTRQDTVNIVLNSLRFLTNEGLKVYAYVILENHLHLLAQSEQIDRDIHRFKSFTARQLVDYLIENKVKRILDQLEFYKKAHKIDQAYQVWQEGIHAQLIVSEDMLKQKVEYIHQNPVKRGYVDEAEHWRYSSARDYAGKEGLLNVFKTW